MYWYISFITVLCEVLDRTFQQKFMIIVCENLVSWSCCAFFVNIQDYFWLVFVRRIMNDYAIIGEIVLSLSIF